MKCQQNQLWAHPACQFLHSSLAFAGCHISLELPLQPSSTLLKILKRKISLSFTPPQLLIAWFLACFGSYWKGNAVIFSSCPSSVWLTILLGIKKIELAGLANHCLTCPAWSSPRHYLQPSSIPTTIVPARINIMFPIRPPGRRELLYWRRGEKVSEQNGERRKTKDRWNFLVRTCPSVEDTFSVPPGASDLFHQSETSWLEVCLEGNYQLKDGTIKKNKSLRNKSNQEVENP